jgi:UDP-N-acetylglucosamine--N-acetylmuramyl-(pentapeptide) pyrophosphoryl-undecaprenol N-acetylglucosamine transferase
MKKIMFTGGGTAGHVTPNIALIDALKDEYEICYVGSYSGIEKELIEKKGIEYHGISSGKLRRYFDLKNFSDIFRVLKGIREAKKLVRTIKPDIVFSKGGFVSVPVVIAAKRYKVPVISHESDMTPGLANKLAQPFATKVCTNFPETVKYLKGKGVHTGTPIRAELFKGDRKKGLELCGFVGIKPVLLVVGGSTGAAALNNALHESLDTLLKTFNIIHLCGKGKADESYNGKTGYVQFEYINEEMADIFAAADIVLSRAGANAICELLALKKPNVLVPLPASASRGDQILNAESFEKQGYSVVLNEEDITPEKLVETVNNTYRDREKYIKAMSESSASDATGAICDMIREYTK